jgi:hypothetical protein
MVAEWLPVSTFMVDRLASGSTPSPCGSQWSRGEPAGFAGGAPSWEGMGTLSGFPYQSAGRDSPSDSRGSGAQKVFCSRQRFTLCARPSPRFSQQDTAIPLNPTIHVASQCQTYAARRSRSWARARHIRVRAAWLVMPSERAASGRGSSSKTQSCTTSR